VNVATPLLAQPEGGALVARRTGPYDRSVTSGHAPLAIDRGGLDAVFSALERRAHALVRRDRAIVLEEINSTVELPTGWTDVNAGRAPSP
jgi:hypothetical protein